MKHSSLIIIPYRDRDTHLSCLLLYLNRYFSHIDICVVEQFDDAPWNKGLLFNAAYKEVGKDYDYLVLHDCDFIPSKRVDYSPTVMPTLLSTECSQFGYGQCYPTFFGGVVGMTREHYLAANGFSNKFRGWGGEDDDIRRRLIYKGLTPGRREGNRFENFVHPRLDVLGRDKNNVDYNHNLQVLQEQIDPDDGLNSAQYMVVANKLTTECKHLRIRTI